MAVRTSAGPATSSGTEDTRRKRPYSDGAADPSVAEPLKCRPEGGEVAVVDPAGLEAGRESAEGLSEFGQSGRGRGSGGSRRSWRRPYEPWRVAGDELVEHRRDVVSDLAGEFAALPAVLQSDEEIPRQP